MKKTKGDVCWTSPGKKNPIAWSTKAISDLIVLLAQQHCTIQQVHDAVNYNVEAKAILQKYIDAGHGQETAQKWFRNAQTTDRQRQ